MDAWQTAEGLGNKHMPPVIDELVTAVQLAGRNRELTGWIGKGEVVGVSKIYSTNPEERTTRPLKAVQPAVTVYTPSRKQQRNAMS